MSWGQGRVASRRASLQAPAPCLLPWLWLWLLVDAKEAGGSRAPHSQGEQAGMAPAVTCSAVSRHRAAPAGHPGRGGPRRRAGPCPARIRGAGGARVAAGGVAAPRPGLPRLPPLHPLPPLPRGVLHHRHPAGPQRPRQGKRRRPGTERAQPGPTVCGLESVASRRETSTSSR